MGGLAFKQKFGIESKRISQLEFVDFSERVEDILHKFFRRVHSVASYFEKESHGDKDIIVSSPYNPNWQEGLKQELGATYFIKNSSVHSYLIDGFQLDVDCVDNEVFESHCFYCDFDPSGNLMGKLYHKFNLRYGGDGLFYILRGEENAHQLGKIIISKDNQKICEFLGLDFFKKRFEGFLSQKEIFEWICKSQYFDTRIFAYENMNHIARTRDRKRPSYRAFMKYIQDKYQNVIYNWPLKKEDWLEIINNYFPESDLINKISILKHKHEHNKLLKSKFSGGLVMEWTGATGKQLGNILYDFKSDIENITYYGTELTFDNYLENNTSEQIKAEFLKWFNQKKSLTISKK